MRLLHVAVERCEIEIQLTKVLGLETVDLQLNVHQAIQAPVEEQQVDLEIRPANLDGIMAADKTEIATEFDEEVLQLRDESVVEIRFRMVFGKVQELDEVA